MNPQRTRRIILRTFLGAVLFSTSAAITVLACSTFTVTTESSVQCVTATVFGQTIDNVIIKLQNHQITFSDRYPARRQAIGQGFCGHPTFSSTVTQCWPDFYSPTEIACFPAAANCTRWDQFVQNKSISCGFTSCSCPNGTPDEFSVQHTCSAQGCRNDGCFWNYSNNTCNEEQETCGIYCSPYWPLDSGGCVSSVDYCSYEWGCDFGFTDGGSGCCCYPTPILIDIDGNQFDLTDAYHGVHFDLGSVGRHPPVAWTASGSSAAWLALDRNGNGQIDNGKELFGNFTIQPHATQPPNGFLALAEFDRTDNGGNNNNLIDAGDAVFLTLRLWQDKNHNGISENTELYTLSEVGIVSVDLDFKLSKRTDRYGNQFRYRSKVGFVSGSQRFAWDVILKVNPPPSN